MREHDRNATATVQRMFADLRFQRSTRSASLHQRATSAVAAGAVRMGHAVGAVLTERRVLGPVEWRLMSAVGLALCALSVLVVVFPRVLAYPAAALGLWGGLALLWSAIRLRRSLRPTLPRDETPAAPAAPSPKEGEG